MSATGRSGNRVAVSSSGVTSSDGPSIEFLPDGLGRVYQINDPAHHPIRYGYDANGDLKRFTNQDGRAAVYGYAPAHYLASISGETGPPLRTLAYDPVDGRFASITDGAGNVTTVDVDLGARTQTIGGADPRLTTVLSFDDRGNTVQVDEIVSRVLDGDLSPLTTIPNLWVVSIPPQFEVPPGQYRDLPAYDRDDPMMVRHRRLAVG